MLFQKNKNKKVATDIPQSRLRVEEIKRRKRRWKRLRAFFVAFLIAIILTSVVIFIRNPLFLIKDVSVSGTQVIHDNDVKKVTEDSLSGFFAWLLPKRSSFLFNKNKLEEKLEVAFPRIAKVVVSKEGYKKINIEITERSSVYLWCEDSPSGPIINTENCYYVDDTGYIFSKAPFFSGTIYFRFFGPRENLKEDGSVVGTQVFMPDDMARVVRFKESLEEAGLMPIGLSLYEDKSEASFFIFDGSKSIPPRIIFNVKDDLVALAENVKVAIVAEPLASRILNEKDSLLYLDLSYDGKVYYKFSEEQIVNGE
jgi:hypothetical protein